MNSLKCHHLKVDSSKANNYYNSYRTAFLYPLSESISVSSGESIIYSLISATIPYAFYGLNQYNYILDVKETYNNVTHPTKTIYIPYGNYDAYSFAKKLTSLLNHQYMEYSITYNKISNKYVIYTTKNNTHAEFLFSSGPNRDKSCFIFLGFPHDADVLINNEPMETAMIIMNDIYYLQIKSDLGNQNVMTSDSIDNILEVIPITPSPLSFIYYAPHIQTKYLLSQSNLQSIRFELTDNYNRPIDLNGIPFVLNIKVEIVKNIDYEIPTGIDPRGLNLDNNPIEQTPLERIVESNGAIIDRPSPISLNDVFEMNIIQRMIDELAKDKKHKFKRKN